MTRVYDRDGVPTRKRGTNGVPAIGDIGRVRGRVDSQFGRPFAHRSSAHEGRPQRTLARGARGKGRQLSRRSGTGADVGRSGKGQQAASRADAA